MTDESHNCALDEFPLKRHPVPKFQPYPFTVYSMAQNLTVEEKHTHATDLHV